MLCECCCAVQEGQLTLALTWNCVVFEDSQSKSAYQLQDLHPLLRQISKLSEFKNLQEFSLKLILGETLPGLGEFTSEFCLRYLKLLLDSSMTCMKSIDRYLIILRLQVSKDLG